MQSNELWTVFEVLAIAKRKCASFLLLMENTGNIAGQQS